MKDMESTVSLQMAVVPQVWLDTVLEKLQQVEAALTNPKSSSFGDEWIESSEMQPIVGSTNIQRITDIAKASEITMSREDWYKIYLAAGYKLP